MGDDGTEINGGGTDYGENGFAIEVENGAVGGGNSVGSSCESFRMYKRRRHAKTSNSETKLLDYGKVAPHSVNPLPEKVVEESMNRVLHNSSFEWVSHPRIDSIAATSCLGDCPLNRWRNIVLEQLYQSLDKREGGLQGCIRDALQLHPESGCRTATKVKQNEKCSIQKGWMVNGIRNAVKGHGGAMSDGLLSESNLTNTESCRRAFFDVVVSEKFAQLCCLLLENFQGIKVDNILDIRLISSRMNEGAYERSPMLFHSDMQELWTRLQKIGAEMVSLGKILSDKFQSSYREQFLMEECVLDTKKEQAEACGVYTVRTCRHCGGKADGMDCLVCDSCEESYHVSCTEPAVEEIPSENWFCTACTANGTGSPHDDCALCDELNSSRPPNDVMENEETSVELEENSDGLSLGLRLFKGGTKKLSHCNVCGSKADEGEDFRVCGHPFCPHKYYHVRCLTDKQLGTYSPCWYCPSCLCRGCLTDRDDGKIVLCDGCDHAYHVYCMLPPRTLIPRGKWFCRNCDAWILQMRKAKRAYVNIENEPNKRGRNGKGASVNVQNARKEEDEGMADKSGGVDMLLTAARTLNYEEKMAAIEMKILKGKNKVLGRGKGS